jgi:signal transduction histidine kinase
VVDTVRGVPQPAWISRDDAWWAWVAAIMAVAIGLIAAISEPGVWSRAAVVGVALVSAAGFATKARWPRLPGPLLAVWTFTPIIIVNLRQRGEGTLMILVVSVGLLMLTEPDRRVRWTLGAFGVLAPAAIEAVTHQRRGWPFWMMGIVFGWLSGEQMRRFRSLVAELEATRERIAVQAVHLERRRLAAELHDLVGHSLTVVMLHVTGARRRLGEDPASAAQALQEAEEIGRASLAEIRRNVAALRDQDGAGVVPTPSAADVGGLVNRMRAANSDVSLAVSGDLGTVEAIVGLALYRVVQESLNNASRHAPGASVRVVVIVGSDEVEVSVANCGGAAAVDCPVGVGLIGMRERVEAVGGTLDAGPAAGGWLVRARVPRPAAVDDDDPAVIR